MTSRFLPSARFLPAEPDTKRDPYSKRIRAQGYLKGSRAAKPDRAAAVPVQCPDGRNDPADGADTDPGTLRSCARGQGIYDDILYQRPDGDHQRVAEGRLRRRYRAYYFGHAALHSGKPAIISRNKSPGGRRACRGVFFAQRRSNSGLKA